MKKASKDMALTLSERCKNILAGNWRGQLHTVKADSKGSKEEIHSSRVKYLYKRGKPYIWVPEDDLHNVNTIIDERASFSVLNAIPSPLMSLLKSIEQLPARVALTGDVVPLKDEKVKLIAKSLRETILSEREAIDQPSYSVSGILSSSSLFCTSRSENLQEILDRSDPYAVYKFNISSCTYVDSNGVAHELELNDVAASKTDPLAPFSEKLIDGINQSQARRKALMLFCLAFLNTNARDAFMISIDRRGFDVLGKIPGVMSKDGLRQYQWKEFRFTFNEEASDIEAFCRLLVEMEEEALKTVSTFSGLG